METTKDKIHNLIPKLLSVPFKRLSLEKACEKLGWKEHKAYFKSAEKNSDLYSLCVPLNFWETWTPESHKDFESYELAKKIFYDEFKNISKMVSEFFGEEPMKKGKKANYDQETLQVNGWLLLYYHYAVWRTDKAILVLQQCGRDIAKGIEVSLWIYPLEKEEKLPPLPIKVSRVYESYS